VRVVGVDGGTAGLGAEGRELVSMAPQDRISGGGGGTGGYLACAKRALP
jgi:hypothetical protein